MVWGPAPQRSSHRLRVGAVVALLFGCVVVGASAAVRPLAAPRVVAPSVSLPGRYVFRFSSPVTTAPRLYRRFQCGLDGARLRTCRTPYRLSLGAGVHLLRVRGLTSAGRASKVRMLRLRIRQPAADPPDTSPGSPPASGPTAAPPTGGGGSSSNGGSSKKGIKAAVVQTSSASFDVPSKPRSADIEIALDMTSSMGPAFAAAQTEAASIVHEVQGLVADSRFAFVEFEDVAEQQSPTPYKVVQPMTASASAFEAALRASSAPARGVGGDNAEDYDFMFQQSMASSIGWRSGARKFLVVIGDAEPHGAGTDGLAGCIDTSPYAHGLTAPAVLGQLAAANRTVFMVLQSGARASATLQCYQSIAALAGPGSAASSGVDALPTTISDLVASTFGAVSSVTATVTSASPSPATASWVTVSPSTVGPLQAPTTVQFDLSITVPAGTPHGTYSFTITATADGASIGTKTVAVTV